MMETGETLKGEEKYSYEDMTERPFYKKISEKTLPNNINIRALIDFATGAGSMIDAAIKKFGKLRNIFGIDLDPKAIKSCEEKFSEDGVKLVIGNIQETPFSDKSADCITCANAIHLTNIRDTLKEAYRVLREGGVLAINSAYIGDVMYPTEESAKLWGEIAIKAFKSAVSEGYGDALKSARKDRRNKQITQTGLQDYLEALKDTGFQKIEYFFTVAKMNIDDMLAILNYDEFAQGALPGIPVGIAKRLLSQAARDIFSSLENKYIERTWVIFNCQK